MGTHNKHMASILGLTFQFFHQRCDEDLPASKMSIIKEFFDDFMNHFNVLFYKMLNLFKNLISKSMFAHFQQNKPERKRKYHSNVL
jgi:hypothetical protein